MDTAGPLSEAPVRDCPQHGAQPGETGGLRAVQGHSLLRVMESCCDTSQNWRASVDRHKLLRNDGLEQRDGTLSVSSSSGIQVGTLRALPWNGG